MNPLTANLEVKPLTKEEKMMESIVRKLGTSFSTPEQMIVAQFDKSEEMYFISSGDCAVNIIDHNNQEYVGHKLLVLGAHFGEIGLIYNCNRTASVQSRNYNTMATLDRQNFMDLMNEMPDMLKFLKRHIYNYTDPLKTFTKELMIKLPYFGASYMHKHVFHKIIYSFQNKFYNEGEIILHEGDKADQIIFVVNGYLEMVTEFEGNEFVLERLTPGTILNYRNVFTDDQMQASVRSLVGGRGTSIQLLETKSLRALMIEFPDFGKRFQMYENQLLKKNQETPLDYILPVRTMEEIKKAQKPQLQKLKAQRRKNLLKNIVFNRIMEIRILKSKPKLGDILKVFKTTNLTKEQQS